MVREVKNLTNIRLTESVIDGIWLHFESKEKKVGIQLDELIAKLRGGITGSTVEAWAREQLDRQEVSAQEFYEKAKNVKHTDYEVLLMVLRVLTKLEIRIKQMDKQEETNDPLPQPPSNEFLKEGNAERTDKSGTRPSPPIRDGY